MISKVGIIDIGSNSIKLVVFYTTHTIFTREKGFKYFARLGECVDNNRLNNEGIKRLHTTLNEIKEILSNECITHYMAFATAAIRNSENKEEIIKEVEDKHGIKIEIINTQQEAFYGIKGAHYFLKDNNEAVYIDMGGASTEVTYYKDKILKSYSLNFGSVILKSKFVKKNIPNKEERKKIKTFFKQQFEEHLLDFPKNIPIILIGGVARDMLKIHRNITHSTTDLIQYQFNLEDIKLTYKTIKKYKLKQIKSIEGFTQSRADLIIPCVLFFKEIYKFLKPEIGKLSMGGAREGYLIEKSKNKKV